jgi:hypothetical protein
MQYRRYIGVREDWGQVAMISIEMDGFSSEKAMRVYLRHCEIKVFGA